VTVVSEIRVVGHNIRIIGNKASLAAVIAGQHVVIGKVSGLVHKCRVIKSEADKLCVNVTQLLVQRTNRQKSEWVSVGGIPVRRAF